MWKFWQYHPLILVEAYQELNKWDKVIKQQDYAHWKHHLASPSQVSANAVKPNLADADTARAKIASANEANSSPADPTPASAIHSQQYKVLNANIHATLNKHLLTVVRHHYKPMNCMRRCLALKAMIEKRQGLCQFHIGVKIDAKGQVSAHSWISANEQLVNDSMDEVSQYKEITHNNALFAKATISD